MSYAGPQRETQSLDQPGTQGASPTQSQSSLTPFASEGPAAWEEEGQGGALEVIGHLWPVMIAIFLSGTFVILIFPFFTYIESSGLIGESLPKVRSSPAITCSHACPS